MTTPSFGDAPAENPGQEIRRLREIIAHNSDWLWEVDAQGRYTFCSQHCQQMLGYAPEYVLGRTPFDFMPADEAARVGALFGAIVAEQRPFSGLINRNVCADGRVVMLETSGVPLFDEAGAFCGYRGIDRDVTPCIGPLDQRVVQLEALYAAAPVALGLVDRGGVLVNANHALAQLLGSQPSLPLGQPLAMYLPAQQLDLDHCLACLDRGEALADQVLDWHARNYLLSVQGVRDINGHVLGLTLALTDVTEQCRMRTALAETNQQLAQANARLQALAEQDALTGLPNRRHFDEVLQLAGGHQALALLMVDVDHFKAYNDGYGHQRGDECLKRLAGLLREGLRPDDSVCRYGGEEFVILLPDTPQDAAAQIARRLCERVHAEHIEHAAGVDGRVTLSIGVATAPQASHDLLARADQALYRAKQTGRNRCCEG